MSYSLQAVRDARRVYVIVGLVRCFLIGMAAAGIVLVRRTVPGAALWAFSASALMVALALAPVSVRAVRWWLAIVLGIDMALMSLRLLPFLGAETEATPRWLAGAAAVTVTEPFLFVIVPLLLLTWAYGKRGAMLGTLWSGAIQLGGAVLVVVKLDGSPVLIADALGRIVLMLAISLIVAVLAGRQRSQIDEMERAQARLANHAATVEQLAVSRERNRMARDLHDTLAHSLAALTIHLRALRSALDRDADAAASLADQAVQIARSGLEESRQAIQALRSDPLTNLGLVGAIGSELESLGTRLGIHTELVVLGESIDLGFERELTAWRIFEETLRNVERHAMPTLVKVQVAYGSDRFVLLVKDDGQGFEAADAETNHFGLAGMRERAILAGGELVIETTPGGGTTVHLTYVRADE
jgi:signal transduction histidine kinase